MPALATKILQIHTSKPITRPLLGILFITILCSLFFILGSYTNTSSASIPLSHQNQPCLHRNISTQNHISLPLQFEAHHLLPLPPESQEKPHFFEFCASNFTDYCPCQDPVRGRQFIGEKSSHKERHCPESNERVRCLTPKPVGYRNPFPWPKSKDYAWYSNVPFPRLAEYKKSQNWVRLKGERFVFPGGGTSFPKGVKGYVDAIRRVVPLKSGDVRIALDIGCGVASFGAALMDSNILTMSIAPRDIHEAQVQFALERGLPAMLGILSTYRLPFPSRSFDMVHCSRCLVPWTAYDGLYLLELDRILRPGGYWVLSGPPINWRMNYKGWQTKPEVLENEQNHLEDLARRMCWKKISERENIAVWQKPTNHIHCSKKLKTLKSLKFCTSSDADIAWYTSMTACIFPLPGVRDVHDTSGGALAKWPKRLDAVPPRIRNGNNEGITVGTFDEDNRRWKKRVSYYGVILKLPADNKYKYRNVMDMNAGFGGFAAAMAKYPVWVMNVVPFDAKNSSLGVIYERGLIGAYMNWCEPFSTYPRTYDLIHACGVFSMYMDKCDITDILLEIHRILRPEGAVIIRDHVDILVKVERIVDQIRWKGKILHSEGGAFHPEKILIIDNSE